MSESELKQKITDIYNEIKEKNKGSELKLFIFGLENYKKFIKDFIKDFEKEMLNQVYEQK